LLVVDAKNGITTEDRFLVSWVKRKVRQASAQNSENLFNQPKNNDREEFSKST
jgi:hypothetical protein